MKDTQKTLVIRFMAGINQQSVSDLIGHIESRLQNFGKIRVLISSPGGEVFWGISAYNFLKGIGKEIETFNFGSVDSIASVIYCAGKKRFCVPNARFLIHSVSFMGSGNFSFEEKHLKEQLKSLGIDRENIAKIIATNCAKEQKEVEKTMLEGTTFNTEQAKEFGLVHEIEKNLLPESHELIGIS